MANTIKLKRSSTASDTPSASDLEVGELAINTADAKLFTKHTDNSIKEISGSGGSSLSNVVEDTTPQLGGDLQSNGNDIDLADNDKLIAGTGGDLEVYSDGTDGYIDFVGADGETLFIRNTTATTNSTDGVVIETQASSPHYVHLTNNGAVRLGVSGVDRLSVLGSGSYFNHDLILNGTSYELKFRNGSNYVTLDAVNAAIDTTVTLPNATGTVPVFSTAPTSAITDGTNGQVLTTDGSGGLSFTDGSGVPSTGGTFTGDVTITSAGTHQSANLMLNNTDTSNNFGKAIEAYRSGIGTGQRNQIMLGKDGSANDTATLNFYYAGNASSSNRFEVGFWGADSLLNVLANGNVGIGETNPSHKLDVAGDINFTGSLYQNGSAFSGGGSVTLSAINTAVTTNTDSTNIGTNSSGGYRYNTAFGYNAGASLDGTGSTGNTMFGAYAGDAISTGDMNTALGMSAAGSLTTGYNNCAIGRAALFNATTGYGNVSIGFESGQNLNGTDNVGVGTSALQGASAGFTGDQNVALGYRVMQYATTASLNTIAGPSAGRVLTTGSNNTFLGAGSGNTVTTGGKNTFIGGYDGNEGGLDLRTSSNNIVLSDGDGNIRQYIDSSGGIRVGTTTNILNAASNEKLSVKNTGQGHAAAFQVTNVTGGFPILYLDSQDTTNTSQNTVAIRRGGSQVGGITTSASTTAFNTVSDHRLKENVTDMTGAITRVKALAPKRFNFIADADTTVDGFLAHEAQAVVPEAVTGTHNEVDDDGNAVMQGIDQAKLVPLLTGALQEAIAKIETLETQVTDLTARVTALEGA